jgi:hypothetical protein
LWGQYLAANVNHPPHHPGNEKTNIREANAQQPTAPGIADHRLNSGAACISRQYIFFFSRSSSSFIARLKKGGDDFWKTVRVSMSDGVT